MRRREFLLATLGAAIPTTALGDTPLRFVVGQVWSLRPPLNPEARIRVGRIEDSGATVHISLWGVDVPDQGMPIASPFVAGHLPVRADSLARSVDHVVDEPPPEGLRFEEGYQTWRNAHGGVFTITVSEIVDAIFQSARNLPRPG